MHGEPEIVPDRNDGSALRVAVGRVVLRELRDRAAPENAELLRATSPSLDGIRSGTRAILDGFLQQGLCPVLVSAHRMGACGGRRRWGREQRLSRGLEGTEMMNGVW